MFSAGTWKKVQNSANFVLANLPNDIYIDIIWARLAGYSETLPQLLARENELH